MGSPLYSEVVILMSEEKQIPSRSAQNLGLFGRSFCLQAVSAKTGKRTLRSPLRLRGRASGLWKMSGKGRPYTGKHPSSISKLADQASPCSANLGVKGGQRLRPVSVTSPPLNLAPSGPPGKARRISGKEEGGFLPAPILAGVASALQLTPAPPHHSGSL